MPSPRLLVAVSPHGYGHLAQVAPVIDALTERLPELQLTLRTTLDPKVLQRRIGHPFELQQTADDFGMVSPSALEVDVEASHQRFRRLHDEWRHQVTTVADQLAAAAPDIILSDIPYLTLAAAHHAEIPSVALCSLNWADIYRPYATEKGDTDRLYSDMVAAYNRAERFFQATPFMPMPQLKNLQPVPPVAQLGTPRRDEICKRLGLSSGTKLVAVALGGIGQPMPLERWPKVSGVHWLMPVQTDRDDCDAFDALGITFSDLIASADLILTKPGYGTFVEAAAWGAPTLYIPRGHWPEEPHLIEWQQQRVWCRAIGRDQFEAGDFHLLVEEGLAAERGEPEAVDGAEVVAQWIADRLCRQSTDNPQ